MYIYKSDILGTHKLIRSHKYIKYLSLTNKPILVLCVLYFLHLATLVCECLIYLTQIFGVLFLFFSFLQILAWMTWNYYYLLHNHNPVVTLCSNFPFYICFQCTARSSAWSLHCPQLFITLLSYRLSYWQTSLQTYSSNSSISLVLTDSNIRSWRHWTCSSRK